MTTTTDPVTALLEHGPFAGSILTPDDSEYDDARALFNKMIDRRPVLLVRPSTTVDVATAVAFAVAQGLEIAVRSGGHSVAGHSMSDGGMVIDLARMNHVSIAPDGSAAVAGTGASWRDFDLEAGRAGAATPGGVISTTGVGGFTLGGGVGWLSRRYGLTCDNLIGATLVTASGEVIEVSEKCNADILWGLRGGGGNFGVVTEMTFRLHPIARVVGGIAPFDDDDLETVLRHYGSTMDDAPDTLGAILDFSLAPEDVTRTVASIISCSSDVGTTGTDAIHRLGDVGTTGVTGGPTGVVPRSTPLVREFSYPVWQQMLDHTAPKGRYNYWKTVFLDAVHEEVVEVLASLARTLPTSVSRLHLIRMGGAASRQVPDHTAFAARYHPYVVHLITAWEDENDTARCVEWTKSAFDALSPMAAEGAYLNFIGDEGNDRIRASYGERNYARLVELKKRLDPNNVFRLNQNITPD
nr:FAD-binding oxidoreductase [Rhodococcus sp. (in: high G+C Gram-positive bacteria)]